MSTRGLMEIIQNAIEKGLKNPNDYFYVYSINSRDFFEHKDTKNYISVSFSYY